MTRSLAVLLCAATLLGCTRSPDPSEDIVAVMRAAEFAWNAGDLEGYMECYWRSDELRFAGGGGVNQGWEAVLASYQRAYPDRAAMGRLTFSELDVTVLAPDAALVFGRWRLDREGVAPAEAPHGLYTLLVRRFDEGWRIVHDHTSAASP